MLFGLAYISASFVYCIKKILAEKLDILFIDNKKQYFDFCKQEKLY